MRKLSVKAERLTDLDPAELLRVAGGEATRDGKCRSLVEECVSGVRCAVSLEGDCVTGAGR